EGVVFKFTNVVCESYNKSWVVINKCRLYAISRNKTIFNFNGTVLHPVYNIFTEMEILKKANGYKPWIFKATMDACRFVKKSYNPVVVIIYSLFKQFSNINHTCPYMGDQIIKGFYLRPELLLGLPVPSGEYLLTMTWLFNKKRQFCTNVYFEFTEDL
ncbi:hypothetical protein KR044_006512, partial [Drosophila immigrans]